MLFYYTCKGQVIVSLGLMGSGCYVDRCVSTDGWRRGDLVVR